MMKSDTHRTALYIVRFLLSILTFIYEKDKGIRVAFLYSAIAFFFQFYSHFGIDDTEYLILFVSSLNYGGLQ